MRKTIRSIRFWGFAVVLITSLGALSNGFGILRGDDEGTTTEATETVSAKDALAEFNDLIGGWRGTGQPRRGSARGAWRENAEWVWEFDDDAVSIRYDVSDGKLMTTAEFA